MYKSLSESVALVGELKKACAGVTDREILVCPPFVSISAVAELLKGSNIAVGGQNLHWEQQGAFTGEIAGPMLKIAGCRYVIVGHSERRQYFGETDESVNKKMKAAFKYELTPIVCVGETLQEREAGKAFEVVQRQIQQGASGLSEAEATATRPRDRSACFTAARSNPTTSTRLWPSPTSTAAWSGARASRPRTSRAS
jgi:triosephosphate isomerase